MRINVYSQELEKECAVVRKGDHIGVRLYFDGSPRLHNTPDDDDRSAITFWLPNNNSFTPQDLRDVFLRMASMCCGQGIPALEKLLVSEVQNSKKPIVPEVQNRKLS